MLKSLNQFLILSYIIGIVLISGIIFWNEYIRPFEHIKCGSGEYVIYQDVENPYFIYNINNAKMQSKKGVWSKSIMFNEDRNGITSVLYITKNINIKSPNFNKTVETTEYKSWLENNITFLPENNILTQQDIANLKICYPNSKMKFEENIKKNNGTISEQFYEIK